MKTSQTQFVSISRWRNLSVVSRSKRYFVNDMDLICSIVSYQYPDTRSRFHDQSCFKFIQIQSEGIILEWMSAFLYQSIVVLHFLSCNRLHVSASPFACCCFYLEIFATTWSGSTSASVTREFLVLSLTFLPFPMLHLFLPLALSSLPYRLLWDHLLLFLVLSLCLQNSDIQIGPNQLKGKRGTKQNWSATQGARLS